MKLLTYFVCLLLLECEEEDNVVELIGFVLGLQNQARNIEIDMPWRQKACLHALCALFFLVLAEVIMHIIVLLYKETLYIMILLFIVGSGSAP